MKKHNERAWRSGAGEPLVVDLPDGQKLYVGKLDEGLTIEVATWRGIGEPDSRVARMIIAASRDGAGSQVESAPAVASMPFGAAAEVGAATMRHPESSPQVNALPRRRAGVIARRFASTLIGAPLAVATVAVISGFLVLARPIPSLAGELGIGSSGVVLAVNTSQYAAGDEVLARVSANSNQAAVVAEVLAVGDGKVTIAANGKPVVLEESQIIGQLVATLPIGAEAIDRPLLAGAMLGALFVGILLFAL